MTTNAFVGKVYLAVGNGASPEIYTRFCEVDDISGIGVKNDTVDATTFCSGGVKEYIPGLGDGNEITISANYTLLDRAVQEGLIDDVEGKITRAFEIQVGDNSPHEYFQMNLAMLSWEFDPSVSAKNAIKWTGKITGPIIRSSVA